MRSYKEETKIDSAISAALENIGALIDVNTVVGTPIVTADNSTIIPVSKVTFGVLSGGGEYGKINIFSKNTDHPYSAGNGTIVSIKPCGFLIKTENSDYKILTVSDKSYDALLEKASEFFSDFKIKESSEDN